MSVTLTLNNSIVFASTIIKNQKLYVNNLQPAIGFGNIILQRILGSPFIWRFNRKPLNFTITAGGGTDYSVSVPNLGRVEVQWLVDPNGKILELDGAVALPKTSTSKRPTKVAAQYDDNAGNITFRFNSVPDQTYTAFFDYQQKAGLITGPAAPWGVVPDEFEYIFDLGFLSMSGMLVNDARFPIWEKDFIGNLLGAQDGLDAQARDIFIGNWMQTARTAARSQGAVSGGVAGRAQ